MGKITEQKRRGQKKQRRLKRQAKLEVKVDKRMKSTNKKVEFVIKQMEQTQAALVTMQKRNNELNAELAKKSAPPVGADTPESKKAGE